MGKSWAMGNKWAGLGTASRAMTRQLVPSEQEVRAARSLALTTREYPNRRQTDHLKLSPRLVVVVDIDGGGGGGGGGGGCGARGQQVRRGGQCDRDEALDGPDLLERSARGVSGPHSLACGGATWLGHFYSSVGVADRQTGGRRADRRTPVARTSARDRKTHVPVREGQSNGCARRALGPTHSELADAAIWLTR
ncbi:unnamed protein product [Protopolystoma xenopodis]|uniref:Uncharacterized protein n=1 Tax=Protopolystoma xenopodis TaxID=117903 RepID=A0A448XSN9_9PLAT|nr:unnamed protein product [Protopolystoma xenopodis]